MKKKQKPLKKHFWKHWTNFLWGGIKIMETFDSCWSFQFFVSSEAFLQETQLKAHRTTFFDWNNHETIWLTTVIIILTVVEHLKLVRARASPLAVVDAQEVKADEAPLEPMYFVEVMCPFCHHNCPYFDSLESMVEVSARKSHCHRWRDFVASKRLSQLKCFVIEHWDIFLQMFKERIGKIEKNKTWFDRKKVFFVQQNLKWTTCKKEEIFDEKKNV